jgi:hypothetical protein
MPILVNNKIMKQLAAIMDEKRNNKVPITTKYTAQSQNS